MGIKLGRTVCLSYSGSATFCGVVVFIGNINGAGIDKTHQPCFAIKISQSDMLLKQVIKHIDLDMITDGWFNNVQYFNYDNNTDDTFIVVDPFQIFAYHQAIGINPVTNENGILAETVDFFILQKQQIWKIIENDLRNKDIDAPGTGTVQFHIDNIDLSRIQLRLFNYDSKRSFDSPSFPAKVKVFGDVDIAFHLKAYDTKEKYRHSDIKIRRLYLEGDISVNYQLKMGGKSTQTLQFGFLRKPKIEVLDYSYSVDFPMYLTSDMFKHPIDWVEWAITLLLELRSVTDMIQLNIGSPFD